MLKKFLILSSLFCAFLAFAENYTATFKDNEKALNNPNMGWVAYHLRGGLYSYPDKTPKEVLTDFEGVSVIYIRADWNEIQPAENVFDWSDIDTQAQRYIAQGRKIALRFVCSDCTGRATPEWVYKAGAKFAICEKFKGSTFKDPIFDDPIFLEKLERFLAAAGKRFGLNPNVAFIDVGTFGLWGEGHTLFSQRLSQEDTDRIVYIHSKLHRKYFPNTQLFISDDVVGDRTQGKDFPLMKRLREELDISFRDDSILVAKNWFHEDLAQNYWQKMPVLLEHQHLGVSRQAGVWDNAKLLEAVEKHHASYLSINAFTDELKSALGDYLKKIDMRMGYRIRLEKISYPKKISATKPFKVEFTLSNAGVAPCYDGGFVALTLKNKKGFVQAVLVDEKINVKDLPVSDAEKIKQIKFTSNFKLGRVANTLPNGKYDVYFSIGDAMGAPTIELPLNNSDKARRYKVGSIKIESNYLGAYNGNAALIWDCITKKSKVESYLTRVFKTDKPIAKAELIATADDTGALYLNGEKIMPKLGGASYMRYVDVTNKIKKGENFIAIYGKNGYSVCGVIAELHLKFKDGTSQTILTDADWKASPKFFENWEKDSNISSIWDTAKIVSKKQRNVRVYKR